LPQATIVSALAAEAPTLTKYRPSLGISIATLAVLDARPYSSTLSVLYASAEPKTPSSVPHWPRCSCHGCRPPGDALVRFTAMFVLPALGPGVIDACPVIWTAPARFDGDASVPCQRELTFASFVVTCTTGSCLSGLRNGLHATSASAAATVMG
jgi:hypothetical protein